MNTQVSSIRRQALRAFLKQRKVLEPIPSSDLKNTLSSFVSLRKAIMAAQRQHFDYIIEHFADERARVNDPLSEADCALIQLFLKRLLDLEE